MPRKACRPQTGPAMLQKNPWIDRRVVEAYERLEAQLAKLGVSTKPQYRLAPPLGSLPSPSSVASAADRNRSRARCV
jgi:hypothetical protein